MVCVRVNNVTWHIAISSYEAPESEAHKIFVRQKATDWVTECDANQVDCRQNALIKWLCEREKPNAKSREQIVYNALTYAVQLLYEI